MRARWSRSLVREHRDSIPKARGRPASRRTSSTVDVLALRHPLQRDGGDGGTMAKKDTASKQRAEAARFAINLQRFFDANARFAINLQRAFNDLCVKLNHAYGQPA